MTPGMLHRTTTRGLGPRIAAAVAAVLIVVACSEPGGGGPGFPAPDTSGGVLEPDAPLFPDATGFDTTAAEDATSPSDDTAPPAEDTTSPADTAAPAEDTATPTCPPGSACNDLDPCTVNDQCGEDGVCRGTPLGCDDGLPCTVDTCFAGQCHHEVQPGFCLIGGVCWSDQQPNPSNPCQRCLSAFSGVAWSDADGIKCSDGDPCTTGEECLGGACVGGTPPPEICDDGIDNNCNGLTDLADPECGGIELCTYHADCYPERVCARWETSGDLRCSEPCAGPGDCEAGHICSKVPGAAQVGFCQQAPADGGFTGAPCVEDVQCRSRLCSGGRCEDLCLNQAACTLAGHTCHPVGDLSIGVVMAACSPTPPGSLGTGQICLDGDTYDSARCASGHCDLMPYPHPNLPCAPLCRSEWDCAPSQECNVVLYAPTSNPQTVPYHPQYTAPTHDAVTACYTRPASGTQPVGAVCTHPNQCSSHKCFPLDPVSPTMWCTTYCEFDQECPAGMKCKAELVTLASAWLQSQVSAQPPAPGARTMVRICKWE